MKCVCVILSGNPKNIQRNDLIVHVCYAFKLTLDLASVIKADPGWAPTARKCHSITGGFQQQRH